MDATDRKLRVFLCHASQDKPVVRELYQRLLSESWIDPWLDEEELYPGQDWSIEIKKAIETTDAIVVCLSNNSITKEGYVQKEIKTALDYSDYKPEGAVFIIPIRLEVCTPPNRLLRWQYADYFEGQRERAFQRLLVSLKKRSDSLDTSTTEAIAVITSPIYSLVTEKSSENIQNERLYYPNKFAWFIISALEEILGKSGLETVLNSSGLSHGVDNFSLENLDSLDKEFDFADVSALCAALDSVYGIRTGNRIAHRVGRASFIKSLQSFGALAGAAELLYAVLPFQSKLRIGLSAMAKIFSQLSDQYTVVAESSSEFVWTIHECPCCYERTTDSPTCYMVSGFLSESIKWILGGKETHLEEIKCKAVGDSACEFLIQKKIK